MHALRMHTFIQAAAIRSDDKSRLQHHQYEDVSQYRLNREILAQHIKKKRSVRSLRVPLMFSIKMLVCEL